MADTMAQQSYGLLTRPTSRQDIISALLNDYGNSFGRDDASPTAYSPVPAMKELPPPPQPSRADSIRSKSLLSAVQRMNMKFQLRGKRCLNMVTAFFRLRPLDSSPTRLLVWVVSWNRIHHDSSSPPRPAHLIKSPIGRVLRRPFL